MLVLKVYMDACGAGARDVRLGRNSLLVASATEPMDFIGIVFSNAPSIGPDRACSFASATRSGSPSAFDTLPIDILVVFEEGGVVR